MISNSTRVIKRDGTFQSFDHTKITHALLRAYHHERSGGVPDYIDKLTEEVVFSLEPDENDTLGIEEIQNAVIKTLGEKGDHDVEDHYVEYRKKREAVRAERKSPDTSHLQDFIAVSKYAMHNEQEGRRETWGETCTRVADMHLDNFGLEKPLLESMKMVYDRRVLPSMRSMQFGGKGVDQHNVRMYNCCFTLANRMRVFQETFYNLLCGTGCGLSVQFEHVAQLPEIKPIDRSDVYHFTIDDSIEGWADSIGELMHSYFASGQYVEFDYSMIRAEGSPLSTSGGKAPGHLGLKKLHEQLREQLDNSTYRKLRPIEVADIICKVAEAVLSGGIRRSSLIILFSPSDSEMAHAKVPGNFEWGGLNYWRRMMNISAACTRGKTDPAIVKRMISSARSYGEPGIYWTVNRDVGCNPCGEIGMYPRLLYPADAVLQDDGRREWDGDQTNLYDPALYDPEDIESDQDAMDHYGHDTGWQFCNLCEVNCAKCDTEDDFIEACKAAAFLGTLQAAYNTMPYLGPVTERIVRREALLGVGLTGMADKPEIAFNAETLQRGARTIRVENERWAQAIGIQPAARLTTIKPSGTASLVLGCVGSGIHPHHARRYFRRVTEPQTNPVAQYFKSINPHMVETKPDGNLCLTFCVEAPGNAMTVKEMPAIEFMDQVFLVYENWIKEGTVPERCVVPGLTHNVSSTVVVSDDEWDDVIEHFMANQGRIGAMSFLPRFGDKDIPFIPREEVVTELDEDKWDYLITHARHVDYTQLNEVEDTTTRQSEAACVGGACEL